MAELGLQIRMPLAGKQLDRVAEPLHGGVVALVVDAVGQGPGPAGGRHLGQLGLEGSQLLVEELGSDRGEKPGDVLRDVGLLPERAGAESGIEGADGGLDAKSRVALGACRIIDRGGQIGCGQEALGGAHRSVARKLHTAQIPNDLAVGQR